MDQKQFKQSLLNQLYNTYKNSEPCHLGFKHRKNIVFGEGNPDANIMLVGEAPGADEDKLGRPFVGRSGKLLNKALEVANIKREQLYITNILKCRPPGNRNPLPEEIELCTKKFLNKQIKIIRPKIIATLGSIASSTMLKEPIKITKIHGQAIIINNITIIPVYHPAYVLRNKSIEEIWHSDIKKLPKYVKNQ